MITFSDGTKMEANSVLFSSATGILRIRTDAEIAQVASTFSEPGKTARITTEEGAVYVGFRLQAIIPEDNCIRVNLSRGGII